MSIRKIFLSLFLLLLGYSVTASATSKLSSREVLLTFDDGPNPLYTPRVLSVLREYNIKSVFFVVGEEVEKNQDLLKLIVFEGHIIGNHTYSHKIIKRLSPEELKQEIDLTDQLIQSSTGKSTVYFRPPTGAYNYEQAKVLKQLNKTVLMWDFGVEKQALDTPNGVVDNLMKRIGSKQKVILLLHDGEPSGRHSRKLTVEALPTLIEELRERGFRFVDPTSLEGKSFIDKFASQHPKIGVY